MSFQLSKQQRVKEILKCGKDPSYFLKTYARISHPLHGLILFDTYDFQDELLKDFNDYRFNVILKARQLGISTISAGYIVWLMLFHRDKAVLVMATKFATAGNLVKKVKNIMRNVPDWMKIASIEVDNRNSFELSNGSSIKATSTSGDAGRSEALSLLVLDEAAHIENLEELWTGLYPTLSCITGDTLVLTSNGPRRIEDFHIDKQIGDYFEINNLEVWGKKGVEKVSHGYVSPESDTLKITTAHGLQLEVTYKHPLYKLACSGGEMTQAHDLKIDDALRVDVGMDVFGTQQNVGQYPITKDFAYMLGGFIAEGWITGTNARGNGNTIWISNTDDEFRSVFLQNNTVKPFIPDLSAPHKIRCSSVELADLMAEAGVDKKWKCDTKQTPAAIFVLPKEEQMSYLSGLFDGDGSVTTRGIVLSSTSHKLLRETQQLLLNMGIVSNITKINREKVLERERKSGRLLPQGKRLQSLREAWTLTVPRSYFGKFADEIGFRIGRKQKRLVEMSELYKQGEGKCETVPVKEIKTTIEKLISTSGKSKRWFREQGIRLDKCLDKNWKKRSVNYEWLFRLKTVFDTNDLSLSKEHRHFFSEMLDVRCFWDEIVSIEKSTNKTYDFTVPSTHSFLQNGILGSNTGGRCIALSCVTKDTFIFTDKGIKEVSDFIDEKQSGGYEIEEYSILGRNTSRQGVLFHNNGKVKTRRIKTCNTYLEGSMNHKLWAYSEKKGYDWHRLDEMSEGDYISVQYGMDLWGNNDNVSDFAPLVTKSHKNIFTTKTITPDIAYVLGVYLAEGSVYKNKNKNGDCVGGMTTFTCGDDLTDNLESIGLIVSKTDKFHHCCSSKTFVEFLEHLGFDISRHAPQKIIPSRLLEMSRENIIALLQGIFDGDGYSRSDRGEVGIGLSSLRMIEQIRIILNNLGILTEYKKYETPPTKLVNVPSTQHRLSLNKEESLKFYDTVGFRFNRKQENKKVLLESNLCRSNPKDIIPNSVDVMKEMFKIYPKGTWSLSKYHDLNISGIVNNKTKYKTNNVSRSNVIKMLNIVRDELPAETRETLERNISPNLKWCEIKEIKESEAETYDFSLPDNGEFWDHSVIYNGILGHQTPNGVGNWFHKTCTDSEAGVNNFHLTNLPWDVHPDRDEGWFDKETKNMSKRQIAQELECSFNTSGETVIEPEDLEWMLSNVKEPKYRTGFDRNFWIWEDYDPTCNYLMSADVSRGDGADFSTFHIIKLETLEVVGEYQGKPTIDMYANMLNQIGREFGNAMLVVENNNIGFSVLDKLVELDYPNVYFSVKSTHQYVEQYQAENMNSAVPGFTTSMKTRPLIIAKFEEFIRNKLIKIYSSRVINEMKTFIWRNGKPQAMKGYNDDLIMALAIGCWVRDTALQASARDLNYQKAFADAIITSNTTVNTRISGQLGYKKDNIFDKMSEAQKMYEQYKWIIK